MVREELKQMTN